MRLVMALFTAVLIGSGRARGTDGDNSATRGNTQVNQGRDTTVTLPGGATMEFVWIEPGTFIMGRQRRKRDGAYKKVRGTR